VAGAKTATRGYIGIPERPSACTGPEAAMLRGKRGRTGRLLVSAVGSQQLCFGQCFQEMSGNGNEDKRYKKINKVLMVS